MKLFNEIKNIETNKTENFYIKNKGIEDDKFVINNKLIVNSQKGNLLNELKKCLSECEKFYFSVAFINFSGLQLLLDSFKKLEDRGVSGRILTSTYLNFTEPKALERIRKFKNIDLKIFVAKEIGFHTKAYIFDNKEEYKIIIGSSNITQSALKSNIEWNVQVISKKEDSFTCDVLKEFLGLWESTAIVNDEFLNKYRDLLKKIKKVSQNKVLDFSEYELIEPNKMQEEALKNLNRLRDSGEDKALVIAATGTGKTYMAAFDVMKYKPKRMLYLVHREDILRKTKETFYKLTKNKNKSMGFLTGTSKDMDADYLFSTRDSMNNKLYSFKRDDFEYIIIDEAHHAASPSYKRIIDYFKPKFLLGMTATPERCDDGNIFNVFDNNIALDMGLNEALEHGLIVPFHYFGITDIDGIDLSDVSLQNIDEVVKRLKVNERVDFIIEKMNFYGYDGNKCKCIGFCASIDHAEYMADEFNKRGIKSVALSGEKSDSCERKNYINRLENDEDDLKVIFTVDLFNEGVDIPSVNLILMLRPTSSPIVFIQQLGRGLRKCEGKTFLTVLDFIGNYKKAFLIAIALNGTRYYDKDSLKVAVATQFGNIPGCTNIEMDKIAQDRILEQLNKENFNSIKYLKEEYFEFKKMNREKIPYFLMDYMKYDGAPDPLKFLSKEKTYLSFVARIEKDEELKKMLQNDDFFKIVKELTDKLPIKRVYEFSILKYLLKHEWISLKQAKSEILRYIEKVDDDSIIHAFNCLNQSYYDASQIKNTVKLVKYEDGMLSCTWKFKKVIHNEKYRCYIEDIINYALVRYEKMFSSNYYGIPFLKLYEQYKMIDVALLSNYTKIHSSFRGSGLITNGKEYFLFVDLHKEADIKESINYKDKFIDRNYFQWQSPNSTSQSSERGKNIVFNKERGINLHVFLRKYKEIDGVTQPYIYIGKGNTAEYSGEKPITVKIKLENEVPDAIYTEFIKKI